MIAGFSSEYLVAAAARPEIRAIKDRCNRYLLENFPDNGRLLDIGCGAGVDTVALGKEVGKNAVVIGIDHDPDLIRKAKSYAMLENVSKVVQHEVMLAHRMRYQDAFFDGVRCERVLQHVTPRMATAIFHEAARVTKKAGRIVFVDTDWASLSINHPDFRKERLLAQLRAEMWTNGFAARGIREHFLICNLEEVKVEVQAIRLDIKEVLFFLAPAVELAAAKGLMSKASGAVWLSQLVDHFGQGYGMATLNLVTAVCTKP